MDVSVQEEIGQIQMERPHVVILGAGASRAAFPEGDKNGRKVPLMDGFVEVLGLGDMLSHINIEFESNNFEDVYNQLYQKEEFNEIRRKLETVVYNYFDGMVMPDKPTLYDHLILSLREKDVIASFNWDPFLVQACRRNSKCSSSPRVLFLHGNVRSGYCEKDKVVGLNGTLCKRCRAPLMPTRLLYPISDKNYNEDNFIFHQWKELSQHLKKAFMITFFGYGAPKTDVSAIELMKAAWGEVHDRNMEQTEIIDIKSEEDLHKTWKPFIHSHHDDCLDDFYKSWISNHPRRTGEAYINQYLDGKFIDNNPIPRDLSFPDLWEWFKPLREAEKTE